MDLLKTELGRFRVLAFLEGVSFLVILFVTMPLKYLYEMPLPNKIFGSLHGLLFILYVLGAIMLSVSHQWKRKKIVLVLFASIIPFGTFWADKNLLIDKK